MIGMRKNTDIIQLLTVMGMASQWAGEMFNPGPMHWWKPEGPRKCALPGCDKLTSKGYCCAAHCRQHRKMHREYIEYAGVSCNRRVYCGWRHCRIEGAIVVLGYAKQSDLSGPDGWVFVTNRGRIVSPAKARVIAIRAGQIPENYGSPRLCASDLWDEEGNKKERK